MIPVQGIVIGAGNHAHRQSARLCGNRRRQPDHPRANRPDGSVQGDAGAVSAATGTAQMLRKHRNLQLYDGAAEGAASLPGWQARAEHGIAFADMTADEMAEIQPGLARRFSHAPFAPGWHSSADPRLCTQALAAHFAAKGGELRRDEVIALNPGPDAVDVLTAGDTRHRADKVVLAAAAVSHCTARIIGGKIPLESERGSTTTLPPGAFDLRMQITFGGHGFVVSPLSCGIRGGGRLNRAVERGG